MAELVAVAGASFSHNQRMIVPTGECMDEAYWEKSLTQISRYRLARNGSDYRSSWNEPEASSGHPPNNFVETTHG